MVAWKADCKGKSATEILPYRDLYIYLLNGLVIKSDEACLGRSFLGNWIEENNSFLFFTKPADRIVSLLLKKRSDLELIEDYYFTYEQWQGGDLGVLRIGQFLITPPWMKTGLDEEVVRILLDPGVVFGSGLHPTTRDCLKAISFAQAHRPFQNVLDLGTGTAVLSLAAALIGVERVVAVDLNPLCVKTARKNVEINDLNETIRVVRGRAEDFLNDPADLVIANIHYEVIKKVLAERVFRDKERIIISGLMRTQARDVKGQLESLRLRLLREWDHEMTWSTMLVENG